MSEEPNQFYAETRAIIDKRAREAVAFPASDHWTEEEHGLDGWLEFLATYNYASPDVIKWIERVARIAAETIEARCD